jgi:predicted DNA-binding transcriptional regulator AlpA
MTQHRRQADDTFDEHRLIDIKDVLRLVPVSKSTIGRLVKAGTFPAPNRLSGRSFWRFRDIIEWIERHDHGQPTDVGRTSHDAAA